MPDANILAVVGLAHQYAAGTQIAPHWHEAHQVVHATHGLMRVSANNRLWFVPPGRALWVPAATSHAIWCSGRVEMRTAYLSKAYPPIHAEVCVVAVSGLMREVLIRLAMGAKPGLDLLLSDVLIAELGQGVHQPLNLPIPRDPRIARLALHLQEVPADQTTLVAWAKRLGFSERNLIRSIRADTGLTFRELRRLTRIMVSLGMLSAGQSVSATAYDVGFETPSAFIHAFRTLTGKTPRQFMSGV